LEECWPCPVFVNYTLAFALQLREKHGKISVRVAVEIQSIHIIRTPTHTHTHTHTHITKQFKYIIRVCKQLSSKERNCSKHVEFHFQNKFEKLVHLVGFIKRKFVTMHSHMNVKLLSYIRIQPNLSCKCTVIK
jgi:hypothetical protein